MSIRLFLLQPVTVFAARVNQASFTYPLAEVTFDSVTTGTYASVIPGMTVLFGTTAGADDLGRQRVRKAATSDTFYIGRSSQGNRDGEVNLQDNAFITVLYDFRVWAKIPYADVSSDTPPQTTWYKDHDIAVGSNTSAPPPVANCSPGVMATIDESTSLITVTFEGDESFAVADGASISTYAWDVNDGTITVGTSASTNIVATFPAGFRWVSLTVTDDNGESHTARCPVFARDPEDDATIDAFEITSHRITAQGQTLSVRISQDIAASSYPDGTLCMIADGEPPGINDRSHMLFIGWHTTDPASIAGARVDTFRETTLNLVDVAGRLQELVAFSQEVETATTPADWDQMTSPNHDKYVHYLLHWHSTALELADYSDTGTGSDFAMIDFASPPGNLFEQVNARCNALEPDYYFTCNTLGQLRQNIDPMLQDSGDRTSTVQATLDGDDYVDVRYTHQRSPRVAQIQHEEGIIVSATTAENLAFSDAPGPSPGQGLDIQSHGNQLTPSQAVMNAVVGHRYARVNAPQSYFNVTLSEGDDLDIEPADMTWVRFTIASDVAARRGLAFTNERGLPHELNIRYSHERTGLIRTVEMVWERETSGTPGVTWVPPESGWVAPDDFWPGGWTGDRPGTDEEEDIWAGDPKAYVVHDQDEILLTLDIMAASPSWSNITGTVTGTILDLQYVAHTGNTLIGAWCLTTAGVWWCNDVLAGTPSWTNTLSLATVQAAEAAPDSGASEFIAMCNHGYRPGAAHVFTKPDSDTGNEDWAHAYSWSTTNFGANWTLCDAADEFTYTDANGTRGYAYMSVYSCEWYRDAGAGGNGRILARRQAGLYGLAHDAAIVYSDDDGATWVKGAQVVWSSNEFDMAGLLHPFPNTTDPLFVVGGTLGANNRPNLWRSTDFGDSVTDLGDPTNYEGFALGYRVNQKYNTPAHVLAWARLDADNYYDLIESDDSGATWSLVYDPGSVSGSGNYPIYNTPNGWPGNADIWFLIRNSDTLWTAPVVQVTEDYFSTFTDKDGDIDTAHGGSRWNVSTNVHANGFALPKVGANV